MGYFEGTSGSDNLVGTNYGDTILAESGNDTIYGLDGNDLIQPGAEKMPLMQGLETTV